MTVRTDVIQHGRRTLRVGSASSPAQSLQPCRRKFLRFFPQAFRDETYIAWERGYKEEAHIQWKKQLDAAEFVRLLRARQFAEIASRVVRIESRTNLLFSFEKMALRDAGRTNAQDGLPKGSMPSCMERSAWSPGLKCGAMLLKNFRAGRPVS